MIYIFDIDGTLADLSHRLHYIQTKPKDWDSFFKACLFDEPIEDVIRVCRHLQKSGAEIVLLTGRPDNTRIDTVRWMNAHNIIYSDLLMRTTGDRRSDTIVKSELMDRFMVKYPHTTLMGIFEDRKQVVDMYRNRGFRVFQVAEGDF